MKTISKVRPVTAPAMTKHLLQLSVGFMKNRVAPPPESAKRAEAIVIDAEAIRAQMLVEAESASEWVN